jgi:hypothetical protein
MTPGLLRPLTKRTSDHNGSKTTEVQHHFSWLHKKHQYSPAEQQQQQQQHQHQHKLQQQHQHVATFSQNSSSTEKRKAMTLGGWSRNTLPGKALLFDKLAKLKKKTNQNENNNNNNNKPLFSGPQVSTSHYDESQNDPLIVVCDFCTSEDGSGTEKESEWLNIEKSVRFSLPESKHSETSRPDPREGDYWRFYQPPPPDEEKIHYSRKRDKQTQHHDFDHYHHHGQNESDFHHHTGGKYIPNDFDYPLYNSNNNNNHYCPEHPMRRNLSYVEGLNDFQYLPLPQEALHSSPCCPCCHVTPPPVMMIPQRCCPTLSGASSISRCHQQQHFDERFNNHFQQQQVLINKSEHVSTKFKLIIAYMGFHFFIEIFFSIGVLDLWRASHIFCNIS